MASTATQPWPSLAPDQQKLLLAALASNKKRRAESGRPSTASTANGLSASNSNGPSAANGINPSLFSSTSSDPFAMTTAAPSAFDLTAGDATLDMDLTKTLDDFNDAFPALANGEEEGDFGEQGEKRKNPDEDSDDPDEQSDEKRRDSEPKEAKKPGRKLLTSEPTTVSVQSLGIGYSSQLT